MSEESLVYRLKKRAEIRRSIQHRKSVQEGKPDRIADLLEEAANEIENAVAKDLIARGDNKRSTSEVGDAILALL